MPNMARRKARMRDNPEGSDLDPADDVHRKNFCFVLSCIDKKAKEGCDRGSEVGTVQTIGGDRMAGPLGVVVSPFRPTSWIEGRRPHHRVEAVRRWCSMLAHLLLDCPKSEPLRWAIFGITSSIFDLWSRPWGVARLLARVGSPWSSSMPSSHGRGRVAAPPSSRNSSQRARRERPVALRKPKESCKRKK